jgi:hypothetical protein
MPRTLGVFFAGAILSMMLIAGSVSLIAYIIPRQLDLYFYILIATMIGVLVGLLVGSLQRTSAGLVAVICLLPSLILELWRPLHLHWRTPFFVLFLFAQAIELSLAFWIAQSLSTKRNSTGVAVLE